MVGRNDPSYFTVKLACLRRTRRSRQAKTAKADLRFERTVLDDVG
jgi:hypothetical protein